MRRVRRKPKIVPDIPGIAQHIYCLHLNCYRWAGHHVNQFAIDQNCSINSNRRLVESHRPGYTFCMRDLQCFDLLHAWVAVAGDEQVKLLTRIQPIDFDSNLIV